MTTISCIIPVYNSRKFLRKMIDSVLCQTFSNFELILINDGSTDGSDKICENYTLIDNRIKVFHKDNGGVSSARNFGIDKAIGKYIIFLDSDDYIDQHMFQCLVDDIESNDADISVCQYARVDETFIPKDNTISANVEVIEFPVKYVYSYNQFLQLINKLFKRSLLKGTYFNEQINYSEDFLFVSMLLLKAKKLTLRKDVLYYYITHKNSLSWRNGNYDFWNGYVTSQKKILEMFCASPFRKELEENASRAFWISVMSLFRYSVHNREKNIYDKTYSIYGKQIKKYIFSSNLSLIKKLEYFSFLLSYNFACLIHKQKK